MTSLSQFYYIALSFLPLHLSLSISVNAKLNKNSTIFQQLKIFLRKLKPKTQEFCQNSIFRKFHSPTLPPKRPKKSLLYYVHTATYALFCLYSLSKVTVSWFSDSTKIDLSWEFTKIQFAEIKIIIAVKLEWMQFSFSPQQKYLTLHLPGNASQAYNCVCWIC